MGDDVDELYYDEGLQGSVGLNSMDGWEEWEEPPASGSGGGWYDEWIEDEYWFDEPRAAQNSQNPWYVSAFPGIGQMVQQIIPGQTVSVRAPMQAAPPPRPQP